MTQAKVIARGVIHGPEAGGDVRLEVASQGDLLRLTDYWIAETAPDVHIYLSPDEEGNVDVEGAVDFGKVNSFSGNLSYEIPKGNPTRQMRTVVVRCKQYSVTFGVAVLEFV